MTTASVIAGRADVGAMVWAPVPMRNRMVSVPAVAFALVIAWRSEPRPLSAVVVTLNWYSKAPMSVLPKRGRPRWSLAGALAKLPALMAGLPGNRAIVWVGPPLLASEASRGLSGDATVPVRSDATQPVLPSVAPIRLWPREVTAKATSGFAKVAVLTATIVLASVKPVP